MPGSIENASYDLKLFQRMSVIVTASRYSDYRYVDSARYPERTFFGLSVLATLLLISHDGVTATAVYFDVHYCSGIILRISKPSLHNTIPKFVSIESKSLLVDIT